jgi:predicted  nucleic acid-binding Zn-ribbon protein
MPHECTNCSRTFPDGSTEMLSGCPDCGGNKFRYRPAGGKLDSDDAQDAGSESSSDSAVGTGRTTSTEPPGNSRVTDTVSRATRNLREWVGVDDDGRPGNSARDADRGGSSNGVVARGDAPPPDDGPDDSSLESGESAFEEQFDPSPADDAVVESDAGEDDADDAEDAAQASARTSMVGADELPDDAAATDQSTGGGVAGGDDPPGGGKVDPAPNDGSDLSELREELNDQFESIKIVEPGQYELNLMELYDREEYIISLMEDGRYAIEVPETWRGSGD